LPVSVKDFLKLLLAQQIAKHHSAYELPKELVIKDFYKAVFDLTFDGLFDGQNKINESLAFIEECAISK
jgi:hypothetical protein